MSGSLVPHENQTFEGQTVYASGHAYRGCQFTNCTVVFTNVPFVMQNCGFSACNFQLDYLLVGGDPSCVRLLRELCDLVDGGSGGGITFSRSS